MIASVLKIERRLLKYDFDKSRIFWTAQEKSNAEVSASSNQRMNSRNMIINTGIMKIHRENKKLQLSSILNDNNMGFTSHQLPFILNRNIENRELIFDPSKAEAGEFDLYQSEQWHQVRSCSFTNLHRYCQVFFNVDDEGANDFRVVEDQI